MRDDIAAAWRYLLLNWAAIALASAVFALGVALAGFTVEPWGLLFSLGFVAVYAGFAHANARAPARRDPQVMFALGGIAQIVMITVVLAPLTYVAATANFPLQDANLYAIDRALGFDWTAYVTYVNERPLFAMWLSYGYSMIRWPLFAIPIVLTWAHRYHRLAEFTLAFGLALAATTALSALVPAIGVYQLIGLDPATLTSLHPQAYLDQVRDLAPVREGALRHLDLFALAGIVTFPSFHAASALLYAWALWPVRWIRPIAVLANGAMLAATPVDGGHYFIDLAAGLAVAAVAIVAARWFGRRLAMRAAPEPAIAAAANPAAVPVE
jgi:PAP2 superfamily